MESKTRTIVKAISWQMLGIITTSLLAWVYTGSMFGALSLALSSAAMGTAFFVLHERAWNRVRWGRL